MAIAPSKIAYPSIRTGPRAETRQRISRRIGRNAAVAKFKSIFAQD
jgi:hypothetical protein